MMSLGVTSVEGLSNPTIKPFITLSTPTSTSTSTSTHSFRVALDPTFFSDMRSSHLHLQLFTKRRILGPVQLGWCLIPAHDIGLLPPGSVRYLSYRLRGRDGARGHLIINLSVRFDNSQCMSTSLDTCHTVIGMPVTAIRGTNSHHHHTRKVR